MKRLLFLGTVGFLLAQQLEVLPLTPQETSTLQALQKKADDLSKASSEAWSRLCEAQSAIKASRKLKESSGSCGSGVWSSEMYSTTSTGSITGLTPRSRWDFDKDYKYLVHSK